MHSAQLATPASTRLDDIHRLINNSLLYDWSLRIEYAVPQPAPGGQWRQWGETLFALQSATPAIESLLRCQEHYPHYSLRLCAEKFRPRTRLMYCVHQGGLQPLLAGQTRPEVVPRAVAAADEYCEASQQPAEARYPLWGAAAVLGALLGSLLLMEIAAG